MKKPKNKKKKSNTYWRKKCVDIAKQVSKTRDGFKCIRCPRSARQGYQMHGSHILAESKHLNLSADPENIKTLCAVCHFWWHENPTESGDWFAKTYPDRLFLLRKKDKILQKEKIQWEKRLPKLKKQLTGQPDSE